MIQPGLHHQTEKMRELRRRYPEASWTGPVYVGTSLPPDFVLRDGLPATGGQNFDLSEHQRQFRQLDQAPEKLSALRGSCLTAFVPAGFAGTGRYVYRLVPVGGGVDVNAALGSLRINALTGSLLGSVAPAETEIAIGSEQPACQIEGYFVVGEYLEGPGRYRLRPFVPNPGYQPGAWENKALTKT